MPKTTCILNPIAYACSFYMFIKNQNFDIFQVYFVIFYCFYLNNGRF